MADWHFSRAESRSELAAAHDRFVADNNAQVHFAHRRREDGRRSPGEVLSWVSGLRFHPKDLERAFFSERHRRVLDGLGYATLMRWRLYGEEEKPFERPAWLDEPGAVLRTLANTHGPCEVQVLLETGMEEAREQVPPMLASLEEAEGGVLMSGTADSLDGVARFLAGLFCPFVVKRPPELREALGRHADEIARLARRVEYEATT